MHYIRLINSLLDLRLKRLKPSLIQHLMIISIFNQTLIRINLFLKIEHNLTIETLEVQISCILSIQIQKFDKNRTRLLNSLLLTFTGS